MPRRSVASLVVAVALGIAVAGSGCGGSPEPGPEPTLAESTTPSAVAPEVEVEAAVRAYFALLEDAGHTGDPSAFERLLTPGCGCRSEATEIRREAAAGRAVTTTYRVEQIRARDVTATTATATVTYSAPESVVVNRSAVKVRTLPAVRSATLTMYFRRGGGGWLVERVVRPL